MMDLLFHTECQQEMTINWYGKTPEQVKKPVAYGLILHSGQGFQYASTAYMNLTKEYGISPSMSRAGTPLDNAPAESFFAILKTECILQTGNPVLRAGHNTY